MEAKPEAKTLVGDLVEGIDDDSRVPLVGQITAIIDDEWVRVAWGNDRFTFEPDRWALKTALDELRPSTTTSNWS